MTLRRLPASPIGCSNDPACAPFTLAPTPRFRSRFTRRTGTAGSPVAASAHPHPTHPIVPLAVIIPVAILLALVLASLGWWFLSRYRRRAGRALGSDEEGHRHRHRPWDRASTSSPGSNRSDEARTFTTAEPKPPTCFPANSFNNLLPAVVTAGGSSPFFGPSAESVHVTGSHRPEPAARSGSPAPSSLQFKPVAGSARPPSPAPTPPPAPLSASPWARSFPTVMSEPPAAPSEPQPASAPGSCPPRPPTPKEPAKRARNPAAADPLPSLYTLQQAQKMQSQKVQTAQRGPDAAIFDSDNGHCFSHHHSNHQNLSPQPQPQTEPGQTTRNYYERSLCEFASDFVLAPFDISTHSSFSCPSSSSLPSSSSSSSSSSSPPLSRHRSLTFKTEPPPSSLPRGQPVGRSSLFSASCSALLLRHKRPSQTDTAAHMPSSHTLPLASLIRPGRFRKPSAAKAPPAAAAPSTYSAPASQSDGQTTGEDRPGEASSASSLSEHNHGWWVDADELPKPSPSPDHAQRRTQTRNRSRWSAIVTPNMSIGRVMPLNHAAAPDDEPNRPNSQSHPPDSLLQPDPSENHPHNPDTDSSADSDGGGHSAEDSDGNPDLSDSSYSVAFAMPLSRIPHCAIRTVTMSPLATSTSRSSKRRSQHTHEFRPKSGFSSIFRLNPFDTTSTKTRPSTSPAIITTGPDGAASPTARPASPVSPTGPACPASPKQRKFSAVSRLWSGRAKSSDAAFSFRSRPEGAVFRTSSNKITSAEWKQPFSELTLSAFANPDGADGGDGPDRYDKNSRRVCAVIDSNINHGRST